MKKLLVIALTVIMLFAIAAMAYAEATLSGEVDTGYKSYKADGGKAVSSPYFFGKMVLNGKLGDDLTGTLVFKDADTGLGQDPAAMQTANNGFAIDEADVTFTESFGSLKFGYFGWNNNIKDILDTVRGDVKTQWVSSGSFKVADGFTIGVAYAYAGTDSKGDTGKKAYVAGDPTTDPVVPSYGVNDMTGIDFGYATDTLGVDAIMTSGTAYDNKGKAISTTGVQGWYKLDALKLFVQYETAATKDKGLAEDAVNEIIGATYDSDSFYARLEYDLGKEKKNGETDNQSGIRLGYKLADGAKIEYQDFKNAVKTDQQYLKLIVAF